MHLVYLSAPWIVDVFVMAGSCGPLKLLRPGARQRSETIESGRRFLFSFSFLFVSGKLSTQAACEAQLWAPSN